jgi:hypothetical protein
MQGWVEVFEPPATKVKIQMSSSSANASVTTPAYVLPGNWSSNAFVISTAPVAVDETAEVTATFGNSSGTTSFDILAPKPLLLTISPTSVRAGESMLVTIRLQGTSAVNQMVQVTSSDTGRIADFEVPILAGQNEGSVTVPTIDFVGTSPAQVFLTVVNAARPLSARIVIYPVSVKTITVGRPVVAEGNGIPVEITLLAPAKGAQTIQITSSYPTLVPDFTINVADGQQIVTANVPTAITYLRRLIKGIKLNAQIGASGLRTTYIGISPAIVGFTLFPTTVDGGDIAFGDIEVFEPLEYDLTVNLNSSSGVATFDGPTFTIDSGCGCASFVIYTVASPSIKKPVISIANGTHVKTAILEILP